MMGKEPKNHAREEFENWVDKALIRIGYWPFYDKNQNEWVDKIKPAEIIEQLVQGGIQVIEWSVPEAYFSFLNVGCGKLHPGFGNRDHDTIFEEIIREARKKNIKVMAGVSVFGGKYWAERNPDAFKRQGGVRPACINGPYRKEFLELITAVAKYYKMDGIVLDGPRSHLYLPRRENGEVICEYCVENYRAQTGGEFPLEEDWNDPNWKRYVRWHEQALSGFIREIKQAIKAVDSRIYVVTHDIVGVLNGWTLGDIELAHEATDAISHECQSQRDSCLYTMETLKLSRSALNGRAPVCYHLGFSAESGNCGAFAYGKPTKEEVDLHAHLALSQASPVCYHSTMDDEGKPHPERTKIYQEVSRGISKEMEWLVESKPVYDIGIHYSQNTRNYYGGSNLSAYTDGYMGTAQALGESHICTGTLLDHQFNEEHLKRYKAIVLPNSACLSDSQVEAVRAYVKEGGGLFATAETSLYDENENKRKNFGLGDVLGVEFNGIGWRADKFLEDYRLKRHPFYLHPHQITTDLDELNITNLPWFDIKVKEKFEVIGSWAEVKEESSGSRFQNGGEWQIKGDSRRPCLIAGKYGKGMVVYAPADLTARWYLERTVNIRKLIANIVNFISPPSITIKAPKSVIVGITCQKKQKRTIIHLVNYSISDLGMAGRPVGDLKRKSGRKDVSDKEMEKFMYLWRKGADGFYRESQIDEVIPVSDVEIVFNPEVYKPKRVYLAPEKKELPIKDAQGGFSKVMVPKIDLHALVVFEDSI